MQRSTPPTATQRRRAHTSTDDTLLSTQDLADRYEIPVATVYRWNCNGSGPRYLTLGRHVRYRLSDVITWENSRYAPQSGRHAGVA